jgi:Ras-related GTP-binding protein A/B
VQLLETQLGDFAEICGADEIVLFEKATFLVISHTSKLSSEEYDSHRHERISNIIKQFKLSCSKAQSQFQGMEVRNAKFTAFIDLFTSNTYMMVVMMRRDVSTTLTQLNIAAARKHFDKFIPENT